MRQTTNQEFMTPTFIQRVAKLVPYPVKNTAIPALAFAYHFEPPADQNLQLGSLFVVIEVMAKDPLASQVVDLIIKTIGEEYYNKEFIDEAPNRFEKAITVLNKHLAKLFESHHGQSIQGMSAVIAVLNKADLYLTQCGKARANLYRRGKATELSKGLSDGSTPAKIFHGIAEGTLKQKDKLVFTTPALLFQFTEKTIHSLIEDNSPAACIQKISQQLPEDDSKSRCAAIIVEVTSAEEAANEPLGEEPGDVMLGRPQTKVDNLKAATLPKAKQVSDSARSIIKKISKWFGQNAWPRVKITVKQGWNKLWTRYVNPNPKRSLVIAVLMVTLIATGITIGLSGRTNYAALTTSYKEVIALTDSAEAKQSLNQKAASLESATSATQKLNKLLVSYSNRQITAALNRDKDLQGKASNSPSGLQKRLAQVLDKINSVTRLATKDVVDFSTIKGFTPATLTKLDDRLYTINTSDGSLYQINPSTKSSVVVGQNDALKASVGATLGSDGGSLYILTKGKGVYQYRPGEKLALVRLSGGEWSDGNAIASYNGNLYILSPETAQIYRHSKTSIGFSASSSYIKRNNTVDVSRATGLAINGSILMVDGGSNVLTFDNGIGKQLPIRELPAKASGLATLQLGSGQNIYGLTTDQQHIYALSLGTDSVSYSKQYIANGINKVQQFVVSDDSQIYLLSGQKILKGSTK